MRASSSVHSTKSSSAHVSTAATSLAHTAGYTEVDSCTFYWGIASLAVAGTTTVSLTLTALNTLYADALAVQVCSGTVSFDSYPTPTRMIKLVDRVPQTVSLQSI